MNDKQENQIYSSQSLLYSGPLPPPKDFYDYEQALPGTANRILLIAEQEAEHRRKNEEKIIKYTGRGQIFAFILAIISLGLIFFSILKGEPLGAIVPAIIALSSLIAVFMGKRKS